MYKIEHGIPIPKHQTRRPKAGLDLKDQEIAKLQSSATLASESEPVQVVDFLRTTCQKPELTNNSVPPDDGEISDFLPTIFSDPLGRWIRPRLYRGEFKGEKIGVVLATMAPGFDSYALNKNEYDSLLEAKRSGKIDRAFIVAARQSESYQFEYRSQVEAEKFQAVLADRPLRGGRFWTLSPSELGEDEWTM